MDKKTRLKRLLFRSAHRGTKESDILLAPFAREHLESMSESALDEFEAFLEENDGDIWDWISGATMPQNGRYKMLIEHLQKIQHTKAHDAR